MLHTLSLATAESAPLPFLFEIVVLLAASALIGYLCYRIGLVPIVGFLLTGVLIGPNALGLVQDQELIEAAAEIGVILLLFTIGLEFSLEQLSRIRHLIFVGGGLQVSLVLILVTLVLLIFGLPWQVSLFTGCLLALSSTAVVMKLLADQGETDSPVGQSALGVLIFQDLAVVAMVLLVPMLGGEGGSFLGIVQAIGTAVGIIIAVLLVARRIMPPILEAVARTCSQEIFLLTVVAVCFGTAYLTSLAGVSLSLGAFLAGLLVSESRFKEYAFGEIMPLQVLFSATFFVSVGLLLDLGFLIQNFLVVLAVVAAVLLLKLITTGVSMLALGQPPGTLIFASLLLGQIGEFSLVLERTGREVGLFPAGSAENGTQAFIAATVILIVLTPFLAQLGETLQRRLTEKMQRKAAAAITAASDGEQAGFDDLRDHVIIAGYGSGGKALAQVLQDACIAHGILTLSPGGANEAEGLGLHVLRGDYARQHILGLAGISRAKLLVIADDTPAMTQRVVSVVRSLNPNIAILACTRFMEDAHSLSIAGANHAISEERAGLAQLVTYVLGDYQVDKETIGRYIDAVSTTPSTEGVTRHSGEPVRLRPEAYQSPKCVHVREVSDIVPNARVCEECVQQGDTWVHLRVCMICGHVGCCDSSKNKHASKHHHDTGHPIVRSLEPGEEWGWCYEDKTLL